MAVGVNMIECVPDQSSQVLLGANLDQVYGAIIRWIKNLNP